MTLKNKILKYPLAKFYFLVAVHGRDTSSFQGFRDLFLGFEIEFNILITE